MEKLIIHFNFEFIMCALLLKSFPCLSAINQAKVCTDYDFEGDLVKNVKL